MTRDAQRPNTASPGPARHSYLPPSMAAAPPPPTSCDRRKRGLYCPLDKQEETRSFLHTQGLAIWPHAPHMEHGAKPPGSFLPTPCFRPIKRLRLRALATVRPVGCTPITLYCRGYKNAPSAVNLAILYKYSNVISN